MKTYVARLHGIPNTVDSEGNQAKPVQAFFSDIGLAEKWAKSVLELSGMPDTAFVRISRLEEVIIKEIRK